MPEPIHTDLINDDGTVQDTMIETYYAPLECITVTDKWLRVFSDNGAANVETRIPFGLLESIGWSRNAKA